MCLFRSDQIYLYTVVVETVVGILSSSVLQKEGEDFLSLSLSLSYFNVMYNPSKRGLLPPSFFIVEHKVVLTKSHTNIVSVLFVLPDVHLF